MRTIDGSGPGSQRWPCTTTIQFYLGLFRPLLSASILEAIPFPRAIDVEMPVLFSQLYGDRFNFIFIGHRQVKGNVPSIVGLHPWRFGDFIENVGYWAPRSDSDAFGSVVVLEPCFNVGSGDFTLIGHEDAPLACWDSSRPIRTTSFAMAR